MASSTILRTVSTALLPLVSFTSLSIYLSSNPASPAYILLHQRGVQLSESPQDSLEPKHDPFDIDDPAVRVDGVPVNEDGFWRRTHRLKLALLITLVVPFVANLYLLAGTIAHATGAPSDDWAATLRLLFPVFLALSHCTAFLLGIWYLRQRETPTHWPTTIHIAVDLIVQFVVVTFLAVLPAAPFPSAVPAAETAPKLASVWFFTSALNSGVLLGSLLPFLQLPPLLVALSIRRGPPLFFPIQELYPASVVDAVPPDAPFLDPKRANVNAEVDVNIPGFIIFGYATPVVRLANTQGSLDCWDLPLMTIAARALPNYLHFKRIYSRPKGGPCGRWLGANLLWRLFLANKGLLIAQSTLTTIAAIGHYAPALFIKLFLDYLKNDPTREHITWGWILTVALFFSNAAVWLITGIIWSIATSWLQGRFKLQLDTMLFAKTLRKKDMASAPDNSTTSAAPSAPPQGAKAITASGRESKRAAVEAVVASKSQIMMLFTVDVDRVIEFIYHSFTMIDAPIEICVATLMLVWLLGSSAIIGLVCTLLCLPFNHLAASLVVRTQEGLMKSRDARIGIINEVLRGIRMLKFMAWERPFETRINNTRRTELQWQARIYQIAVGFNIVWMSTPVLVTVVSFLHYAVVRGRELDAARAFASIAVFNELRFALNVLPETIINAVQGFVSCKRIERYLGLPEVSEIAPFDGGDIIITNATFTWAKDSTSIAKPTPSTPVPEFSLADVSLRFPEGKLSLVCGRLGSGKSLLLSGLLGEADLVAGHVKAPRSGPDFMANVRGKVGPGDDWVVPGVVGYVPQEAWLQNVSVRDNIVFGGPWDAVRYAAVISACSLTPDLNTLEDGDQTEIGEAGLNLSGGQKARVSLARAVYSRASVLYLDDVLSAVDAHTAHALVENCLQGPIMRGRTVVLVSHHTQLVSPVASYIVALKDGSVQFAGARSEFVECGLMDELEADDPEAQTDDKHEAQTIEHAAALLSPGCHSSAAATPTTLASRSAAESETSSIDEDHTLVGSTISVKKAPRKLVEDEYRQHGNIAGGVWTLYLRSLGGALWWVCFIAVLLGGSIAPVIEGGWVALWTSPGSKDRHSTPYWVFGYGIVSLYAVAVGALQLAVMYLGSLRASKLIQRHVLKSVLYAKLRYHETTVRGRLLNRFGKDLGDLDSLMADNFLRTLQYSLNVVRTLITITWIGGYRFLVVMVCLLGIYFRFAFMFSKTAREMRRLEAVTRSPLYSVFGETVAGVAVIRAFGTSTLQLREMMRLSDVNTVAFIWLWTANRWVSARFNLLSSLLVGVTAGSILLVPAERMTPALAGLGLAFAGHLMHDILFTVRRYVALEQSLVAVERLKELGEVPQEAPAHVDPPPPAAWPADGAISVEDLHIRYAPDLPDVLHGLSFNIAPREKIGIVGSTGCGKSTLALSFFRFVEANHGKIVIDGVDIAQIGLTDLRSRIMIIPQDPTILSGTLRSTLDVFDEYDDAEIYDALRRVSLLPPNDDAAAAADVAPNDDAAFPAGGGTPSATPCGPNVFRDLSYPVTEGGDNFSAGQKQLMCMARAILRRNKVLFMDEATASVDYETDALITRTIRHEFRNSTIVTIAHRIHTIIDFDKVLVMDRGRIREFASPAELLRDPKGRFHALCRATGRVEFANLKNLAFKAERKREERAQGGGETPSE